MSDEQSWVVLVLCCCCIYFGGVAGASVDEVQKAIPSFSTERTG